MSLKPGPTSQEGSRHLPMYFLSPAPPLTTVAFSSLGTKVLYLLHILLQYQSAPRSFSTSCFRKAQLSSSQWFF